MKRQVRRLVKRAAKYAGIPLRDPALVAMLGNQPTSSGVDVDENIALNYSAVWAAVSMISSAVASLPIVPYERRKNGHYEAEGHPSWSMLLVSPNPEMTPYVFWETLMGHALTWGNGYALLDRESPDDIVTSMVPIQPNQIDPDRDQATGKIVYRFKAMYANEKDEVYEWWQVLHVPGLGFDGLKGYPVIQQARESIGLGVAAEKFGGAFFGRGCTLGGILECPEEFDMTDRARKNLRESFELLHRGPDNSHRVAILEQGLKFTPTGLPPGDSQFLETRRFQVTEVARWFNIPPHKIRDLENATYSNIEEQNIEFLQDTVRPWLIRIQQECNRKLWGPVDQTRYFACHNTKNLLMTSVNDRYDAYTKGRNGGWLTLNDILKDEGQNPLPPEIGDARLAPSTMKVLGQHGEPIDPAGVKAAMDLLSALNPIHPDAAKALLVAMIPGIAGDALDALVRRLPDYKPATPTETIPDAPPND